MEKTTIVTAEFETCPHPRIAPIIKNFSNYQSREFQICEHVAGIGKIEYDKNIPLVIFHSEGDSQYVDIDFLSQYGSVLHCNYTLSKTKGKFFNYWAYDYLQRLKAYQQPVNVSNNFIPKFLCLNGRPEWHRYYVLQRLVDKNLYNRGYISFLNRYNTLNNEIIYETFLDLYSGTPAFVKNIFEKKQLLVLDKSNNEIHKNDRSHSEYIYKDTSVSLVTETYPDAERGLFITEKSYKPIANCHFQIWISQPGMVDFFRNLGFDMFDDIIDNSYDDIYDDIKRFEQALNSLETLLSDCCSFSEVKKKQLQYRLNKNQNKYLNMKLSDKEIESWL